MINQFRELARAPKASRYFRHDRVRLVAGVRLDDGVVQDASMGHSVTVTGVGAHLVGAFEQPSGLSLGELSDELARHYDRDRAEVFADVAAFVGMLDDARLIEVDGANTWTIGLRDAVQTRGLSLLTFEAVELLRGGRSRRLPPTPAGLLSAVVRAQGIIAVIAVLFTVGVALTLALALGTEGLFNDEGLRALVAAPSMIGIVHLSLVFVHEGTHMLTARLRSVAVFHVVTRGRSVGVLRRRGSDVDEVLISASGPLAATLVGMACAAVLYRFGAFDLGVADPVGMLANCFLLLGLAHLVSLLPFGEDGVNLVRLFSKRRRARRDPAPTALFSSPPPSATTVPIHAGWEQ